MAEAIEACERVDWLGWLFGREAFELGTRVALAWLSFLRSQTLSHAIGRAHLLALTAEERCDLKTCMTVELIERGRVLSNLRGGPRAPSLADVLELQKLANDHRFSDRESRPELVAAIEAASMLMQAARILLAGEPDGPRFADACALAVQATARRLSTAGPHTSAEGLRRWRRAIPEPWRIEIGRGFPAVPSTSTRDRELAGALLVGEICASNPIGGAS